MRLVLGRIAWCGSQVVTAAFGGGVDAVPVLTTGFSRR
jgi:hypothetical protein